MKAVFTDTVYWLAIVKPGDQWEESARRAREALGNVILVTTDEVLAELLNHLSRGGSRLRELGVKMVEQIMQNPNVRVIPQTRDGFLKGMRLYGARADKEYSLTDCVCMQVMKAESIVEVLTNDHHFEQEGFAVLIKK